MTKLIILGWLMVAAKLALPAQAAGNGAVEQQLGAAEPFDYDALGNRISKTTYPGVPAAPVTTQYVQKGTGIRNGLFLHLPHASILEERVGTSVSRAYCDMTAFTATGAAQYYHCDDLGNVLSLTDAGGNVIERYAYDDYGAVTFLTSDGTPTSATTSAVGNPYCWGGLRLDEETCLQNDDGGGYFEWKLGRALSVPVHNLNGSVSYAGKVTLKVVNPGNQESNDSVFQRNNPWSPNSPPSPVTYVGPNGERKKEYVGHVSLLK
jgi:YD repeat-containing protein